MLTKEDKDLIFDKVKGLILDRFKNKAEPITDKETLALMIATAVTSAIAEYDKINHPAP